MSLTIRPHSNGMSKSAVGGLVVALGLAGCAVGSTQNSNSAGPKGNPIWIGGLGPLTAPGDVQTGTVMKWAMQLAVSDINAKGGVLGRPLSLDFENTVGTPESGALAAQKLVANSQIVAVGGETASSSGLGGEPIYETANMPVLFSNIVSDKVTAGDPTATNLPPDPPDIFRIYPSATQLEAVMGEYIVDGLKAKNVIELYSEDAYGESVGAAFKSVMAQYGVALTQEGLQDNQPEYTSVIQQLEQQDPSAKVLFLDVGAPADELVINEASQVGLLKSGMVVLTNDPDITQSQSFWQADSNGQGTLFRIFGPLPAQYSALNKSIADRYQAQFHQPPPDTVWSLYDTVTILADAIQRAGSTSHAAVNAALEKTDFNGTMGHYSFEYTSLSPVPAGAPLWLWHQWAVPAISILEYTQQGQQATAARLVWSAGKLVGGAAWVQPTS